MKMTSIIFLSFRRSALKHETTPTIVRAAWKGRRLQQQGSYDFTASTIAQ